MEKILIKVLIIVGLYAVVGCSSQSTKLQESASEISFDGLHLVENSKVAVAYINPDADFSVYTQVAILEPFVTFRPNWKRDQNRTRSRNITDSDMERIKTDVAVLFRKVFIEKLEADDGYEVVDALGEEVLLLRPAIINLDVTAPDKKQAGRNITLTASAGAATIYIELYDSVTGAILGRASDRRVSRNGAGVWTWSNTVSNSAGARRIFGRWASTLRDFLDKHYVEGASKEMLE